VAPALDLQHRLGGDFGAAPAAFCRAFGLPCGNVDPRERLGGGGDGVARRDRLATSSSKWASSAARAWPPASAMRLASSCSASALKRTAPAMVWRWVKPLSGAISTSACRAGTSTK
jgi:hypothetical protein